MSEANCLIVLDHERGYVKRGWAAFHLSRARSARRGEGTAVRTTVYRRRLTAAISRTFPKSAPLSCASSSSGPAGAGNELPHDPYHFCQAEGFAHSVRRPDIARHLEIIHPLGGLPSRHRHNGRVRIAGAHLDDGF